MRFYVSYIQDQGYCAAMARHGVIEAPSWNEARENWLDILRRGPPRKMVHCAYGDTPTAMFAIPDDWDTEDVLRHYHDVDFDGQWVSPEVVEWRRRGGFLSRLWRRIRGTYNDVSTWRPSLSLLDMARESSGDLVSGIVRSTSESNRILEDMRWQRA